VKLRCASRLAQLTTGFFDRFFFEQRSLQQLERLQVQFFQMKAHDTLIFVMAGVGVLVLAILATFYPARVATTTEPSSALKIV
jgi:ABC-type lipoprotein release transport system permease subunit